MYRDEWALRRQNFLLTIGKAMKELLEGRAAKYDKKGRPISSEIRPNPTAVLFLIKSFADLKVMSEWDTSLDINKLSDRQLDQLVERLSSVHSASSSGDPGSKDPGAQFSSSAAGSSGLPRRDASHV